MPFCCQCGKQAGDRDIFCGGCGTKQPGASPQSASSAASDFLSGISPRNASMLCYTPFVGWIACVIVLAADRFRKDTEVRFHAFQGLYLFVGWLLVDMVIRPMLAIPVPGFSAGRFVTNVLKMGIIASWVFMLVKTSQGVLFRLPIIGELADRSVSEQK